MKMKIIFKYPIPVQDKFTLNLIEGAEILSVQSQGGSPVMWVMIDEVPEATKERAFIINPTGLWFDVVGLKYIATFQIESVGFVGHLFEQL